MTIFCGDFMADALNEGLVMKTLRWAYKNALEGTKGIESEQALATE